MNTIKKHPIGGIKFSDELVHFTLSCRHSEQAAVDDFLQHITKRQINIPFLCSFHESHKTRTCFCVSAKDGATLSEIIVHSPFQQQEVSMHLKVGSLTIFPHKHDVAFVTAVMSLMERAEAPVYSFCTSISALTVNTRLQQLPEIAHQLMEIFQLPENHSPFYPEFQLSQPHTSIVS